jgi:hypothetical protein
VTNQAERIAKLRRAYEAFSSGDFDAVAEFVHLRSSTTSSSSATRL